MTISTLLHSVFGLIGPIIAILFYIMGIPRVICSIFSFFRPHRIDDADTEHSYAVLICARNERAVIERLINSIKAQHYPDDKLHIYVMADNCTDDTADLARAAGATVFERHNTELIGKGYALEALIHAVSSDPFVEQCQGFICFDADNIVDPDFVSEINKEVCNGAELAKGYRCSSNPTDGFVAGCTALYFISECSSLDRGRRRLGLNSFITGTGFYIERSIVNAEGGWHYFTLSEDTELSVDQYLKGHKTVFCHDAIFYDEQPTKMRASLRQRKRWLRGSAQVCSKYRKDLCKKIFTDHSFTSFDQFAQLVMAVHMTSVGFIAGILGIVLTFLFQGWVPGLWSLGIYVVTLYVIFLLMGLLAILLGRRRIQLSTGALVRLLFLFPFFMLTFLPLSVYVLFKKEIVWDEMAHGVGSVTLLHRGDET